MVRKINKLVLNFKHKTWNFGAESLSACPWIKSIWSLRQRAATMGFIPRLLPILTLSLEVLKYNYDYKKVGFTQAC